MLAPRVPALPQLWVPVCSQADIGRWSALLCKRGASPLQVRGVEVKHEENEDIYIDIYMIYAYINNHIYIIYATVCYFFSWEIQSSQQ